MNTIIEKIRAEIRGITETARNTRINGTTQQAKEADAIIHVLDNLMLKLSDFEKEEKPSEDLEEEIKSWHKRHFKSRNTWEDYYGHYLDKNSQLDLAHHFAQWQREKDKVKNTEIARRAINGYKEEMMIQWTGNNLKDLIEFTGKSPRFDEWFKTWDEYESYVHSHGNIFKMFNDDGSHLEVPVGAWIVKTPDGRCIASKFTLKQPESEKIAAAYQLGLADKEKKMMKGLRSYCLEQMELFPGEQDVARATRAVYYDIIGYLDNYERR